MTQRALSSLWYDTVEVCALIFPESGKCQRLFSAMIAAGFSSQREKEPAFCAMHDKKALAAGMRKPDGNAVVFSITGGEICRSHPPTSCTRPETA